ncbi:MAG: hypothetical protein JXR70_00165 [Spirochaetales bacterium]|nr:hypothetical protein [Spirochaetales bacterium]
MYQFYFLAVLFLVLNGFVLTLEQLSQKFENLLKIKEIFYSRMSLLVLGGAGVITGFFKLFATFGGIIIISDFFPAIASLAVGLILFLDFYKESSGNKSQSLENVDVLITQYRTLIGVVSMVLGFLHFIVPGALLL